jgi:glycosyltransferase involved in cell wall biosynthesis
MTQLPAVHQFLPSLLPGDAIGNHALLLQAHLRAWGHVSEIYALHRDPCYAHMAQDPRRYRPDRRDIVIYHYSIGSPLADMVLRLPGRLVLHYHNVTPPQLMGGHSPRFRDGLAQGRAGLVAFRQAACLSVGVSAYNAAELVELGFENVHTIPVLIDFDRLDRTSDTPSPAVQQLLANGGVTFLFVGRIVPNKCQRDLISLFAYYQRLVEPHSRLVLVGSSLHAPSYQLELETHSTILGTRAVEFLGHVTDADLALCYRFATIYVSMSEHEGLGVPLLEAMYRDIPVLAFAAAAVPHTLGKAGVLFRQKRYDVLAEMADLLVKDEALRAHVIQCQRAHVAQFDPATTAAHWRDLISRCASG